MSKVVYSTEEKLAIFRKVASEEYAVCEDPIEEGNFTSYLLHYLLPHLSPELLEKAELSYDDFIRGDYELKWTIGDRYLTINLGGNLSYLIHYIGSYCTHFVADKFFREEPLERVAKKVAYVAQYLYDTYLMTGSLNVAENQHQLRAMADAHCSGKETLP